MMADFLSVKPLRNIVTRLMIPGDKSISHRSVIFGSLAKGPTTISNFLESQDCLHTISCFEQMGIQVDRNPGQRQLVIQGQGLFGLKAPPDKLYVGNSGTGVRLMLGILAAQKFNTVIDGDDSIRKRPMGRVVDPLRLMGATIKPMNPEMLDFSIPINADVFDLMNEPNFSNFVNMPNFDCNQPKSKILAPLFIQGNQNIKGISYPMPMASAQVKSAIMLAGLYTSDQTVITEPGPARDHTERMMRKFGIPVRVDGSVITMSGGVDFLGQTIAVPADISSAAFFMVAGAIVPDSCITLPAIGINPTRTGILEVLQHMGAQIEILNPRQTDFEPVADIVVRTSKLKGINISGDLIPRIIDEIPIIAVAAALAEGITEISGAEELRFKESDRLATVCQELSKFGVNIQEKADGLIIQGNRAVLNGAICDSHGDHRIAMSCAVLALAAKDESTIQNVECINTSFPEFFDLFKSLSQLVISR